MNNVDQKSYNFETSDKKSKYKIICHSVSQLALDIILTVLFQSPATASAYEGLSRPVRADTSLVPAHG